jgi:hypothetical protein
MRNDVGGVESIRVLGGEPEEPIALDNATMPKASSIGGFENCQTHVEFHLKTVNVSTTIQRTICISLDESRYQNSRCAGHEILSSRKIDRKDHDFRGYLECIPYKTFQL